MKRSEALNVIKHTALGMLDHKDRSDVDFYAEQILSDLEEAGMAPPWYEKVQYSAFVKGEEVVIPARDWEDET